MSRDALVLFGCAAGIAFAWAFFYGLGSLLIAVPSDFHDGAFKRALGGSD